MATRAERIKAVVQAVGADIKALKIADGDLSALTTTNKANLVEAINEVMVLASAPAPDGGVQIDDTAVSGRTDVTYSANKILASIEAAKLAVKNELTDGAGAALDTLKELADALDNNPNFAAEIATALGKRVRVDAAQVFTALEKKQGCDNLGIGDPDYNFLTDYTAAKGI